MIISNSFLTNPLCNGKLEHTILVMLSIRFQETTNFLSIRSEAETLRFACLKIQSHLGTSFGVPLLVPQKMTAKMDELRMVRNVCSPVVFVHVDFLDDVPGFLLWDNYHFKVQYSCDCVSMPDAPMGCMTREFIERFPSI